MASRNLGKLAELPAEVREIIWKNIGPQNDSGPKPSMGVLRTCRQLYDEAFSAIYEKEVLCFKASPRYQYRSWISILNRCGATWTLESFDDAISHGYDKLPYSKLRGIRIEIEAPNPSDQGQIICVWKKVRELVELLHRAGQLPDLQINLLDSPRSNWMEIGRPQQSIPGRNNPNTLAYFEDWTIVLLEFCHLRGVPSVKMNLPERFDFGPGSETASRLPVVLQQLMTSRKHSCTNLNKECRGCDYERELQNNLDKVFNHLDRALDSVQGSTGNMMRLERFSSWYDNEIYGKSKYLDELERIYKNEENWTGWLWHPAELKWRYRLMAAFNPLSSKLQKRRFELGRYGNTSTLYNLGQEFPNCHSWRMRDWRRYICRKNFYDKLKSLGIGSLNEFHTQKKMDEPSMNDGWDLAEWHKFYPYGIEPLGNNLFIFEFEMGKWEDQEFMNAPRSRFTGWDGAKHHFESSYERPMHEAMAWLRLEHQ